MVLALLGHHLKGWFHYYTGFTVFPEKNPIREYGGPPYVGMAQPSHSLSKKPGGTKFSLHTKAEDWSQGKITT
jgi:hypothetical protein